MPRLCWTILVICSFVMLQCSTEENKENTSISEVKPFDYYQINPDTAYLNLINLVNPKFPGRGLDSFDSIPEDRPMAYGLILSAETNRYRFTKEEQALELMQACAKWLMDNSDINKNGIHGYGLADANDAFRDNTINPEFTEYTITTAIALIGLIDYYSILDSGTEKEGIKNTITSCFEPYLTGRYDSPIGIPRYSISANDSLYDIFNPASLLAGQMQKFSSLLPDDSLKLKLETRATNIIQRTMDHAKVDLHGNTYWDYCMQRKSSNDLLHIWYINEGIREYVDNGGSLAIDWKKIVDHSKLFYKKKLWYLFREPKYQTAKYNMTLWSGGIHMYALAKEKKFDLIDSTLLYQLSAYQLSDGHFKKKENDERIIIRHEAHLLWGLSHYLWHE